MLLKSNICRTLAFAPRYQLHCPALPPSAFPRFLSNMATNSSASANGQHTVSSLPKSWHFTSSLPPDPLLPTPADSHKTPREQIRPRQVRDAIFSWVRPEKQEEPELLATSPAALRDLDISPDEAQSEDFRQTVAGNRLWEWDEAAGTGGYPWAQCYGGFQFGQWAGQLGDGRAISLFETTNAATGVRYELQLKGAGMTPYSRFADGKAVLRSSIREFVASEALNALGVPTTRALSLTLLPHSRVRRETMEPGAIVVRFAQSWLRLGNFDILRARGNRDLTRKLATYAAENVLGGWESLPGRLPDPSNPTECHADLKRGIAADAVEGPDDAAENRFTRFFREVVRRNAVTVAYWQAYGFMNGVLNTDNTSLMGLSIDFGPFAFMDNFDPNYTPNHDDDHLRYSYRNQPTIIWWNLVRFGEALGELLGAGPRVDEELFATSGVREAEAPALIARAEKLIAQAGDEFKAVFLAEYKTLMSKRLGLRTQRESDFTELFSGLLDTMEELELDFHLFFRRLSEVRLDELRTETLREQKASVFFHKEGVTAMVGDEKAREKLGAWLGKWRERIIEDWGEGAESADAEEERIRSMRAVNPSFVPRGWILDEVIKRVTDGDRDVLRRIMHMSLHPFEDTWDGKTFDGLDYKGDPEEEARWTDDVPRYSRAMQCSCSS